MLKISNRNNPRVNLGACKIYSLRSFHLFTHHTKNTSVSVLVSHATKFGAKKAFSRACAKVNFEVLIFGKNANLVYKLTIMCASVTNLQIVNFGS
jgi:hypothetical protein